jgi:hypothetical protein
MTGPPDNVPTNIDPKSRIISDIFNNRYNKNALSTVKHRLDEVKKTAAKDGAVNDGELVGVALFFNYLSLAIFKKKYENNISFFREIVSKGEGGTKSFIREVFVHIPEITGMLPYPNFTVINTHMKEVLDTDTRRSDDFITNQTACEKELKKITMFPRFYENVSSGGGSGFAAMDKLCLVKSLRKEGLPSEVLGKFIRVLPPPKI